MVDKVMPTSVKPEVLFVEELLSDIRNGQLRLPRFQRPFVWEPADMRQLLDSIYKGYPIGSLLIWDSPRELASLDFIGPIRVPPPPDRPISYILDGHQRLTTLYCSLYLTLDIPLTKKQTDWQYWLFFDLKSREFVHVVDGKTKDPYFPLRSILNTMDYIRECRRIEEKCKGEAEILLKRADEMAQRIKSYKIPVTRIKGGAEREAVEIFARLNSRGMLISPDQMVAALTYQEDEQKSLADHIDDILDEMGSYGFGGIPRKQVLQSILGAAGLDINMNEWEAVAKKLQPNIEKHIEKARNGLLFATQFLYHKIRVPGNGYLPYVHQIIMLAAFFWSAKSPDISNAKIKELKKWFWSTSLTGWFAGANPSQLRDMLRKMEEFAGDAEAEIYPPAGGIARSIPARYDSRSARIRCLMIYMFSQKPMHVDGSYIEPEELRGFEYIFPGISKNLLSNPANRVLLPKKPRIRIRNQILDVERDKRSSFLESHCIPRDAYQYIEKNDAESFIEVRGKYLLSGEAQYMRQFDVEPFDGEINESPEEPGIDTE